MSEYPDWIKDKKIVFLAQMGRKRDPLLPNVPLVTELAKTGEQRQILALISSPTMLGQPYLAPPGVPADRLAILRRAFDAAMHDKAFLADAEKISYSVMPLSADEVARIIHETVTAPPGVVAKARALINTPETAQ